MSRQRLYDIIELDRSGDKISAYYDRFMMVVIIVSLLPLFFKTDNSLFTIIDISTTAIFILDYLFRWITADLKFPKHKGWSFLFYPITLWALFDLLAILPILAAFNPSLRLFKLFRLWKALKALRLLRYSKSFKLVLEVIKTEKNSLLDVCELALGYILLSAMIMFSVEPEIFEDFFDAVYWAVVTLTTVGYGDLYPTSTIGRLVSMFSSFMGIAIVALPTGIITAGYTNELKAREEGKSNSENPDKEDDDADADADE
jgi:voltage-gated potassium channel